MRPWELSLLDASYARRWDHPEVRDPHSRGRWAGVSKEHPACSRPPSPSAEWDETAPPSPGRCQEEAADQVKSSQGASHTPGTVPPPGALAP